MAKLHVEPSSLQGSLSVPSSKSHTLRAILFAALAKGVSVIDHVLPSPDTQAMCDAVKLLGAQINKEADRLTIQGCAGKPQIADDVVQCGNSGLVLRLIGAVAGLIPQYTILTGDISIRHHRPISPLLDALQQLGALGVSSRGDGHAPIMIKGPFIHGKATLDGQDSQPVSGLLIAGAFSPHPIELHVQNPGEKPWVDLTLSWFKRLGIPYFAKEHRYYRLEGNAAIEGFEYSVPGDFSSAAFPIAAALLTGSPLTLHNIDMDDVQGDKAVIFVLQQMGAEFCFEKRSLKVNPSSSLQGRKIDINNFIDALPILAVIGCFAQSPTELIGGAIARKKESDRIRSIAVELRKMGANIEERPDGLMIYPSRLHGAQLNAHQDHRIALSLAVAAMAATSPSTISGVECISKTYPHFYEDFKALGAKFEMMKD